ncbi:MAG: heavy-metal-associated domain-containing protein [Thermomicrobiales bacterium]
MDKRRLVTIGAVATLLSAAGAGGSPALAQEQLPAVSAEAPQAQPAQAQVAFHVPTMGCAGCEYRVDGSIWQAPGILDVAFAGQDVTITYDPSVVTPEEIEAAIEAVGDIAEPLGA